MKNLTRLFTGLAGVFGVLPGVGILMKGLDVPPHESPLVYAGFITAACCVILGLIFPSKARFAKRSVRSLNRIIYCLFGLFIIFFLSYLACSYECVIQPAAPGVGHNKAFFPFWLSGEVADNVSNYGSREAYLSIAGSDQVMTDISKSCSVSMTITRLLFITNYCLLFASLTAAFGFLAILQSKKEQEPEEMPGHLE